MTSSTDQALRQRFQQLRDLEREQAPALERQQVERVVALPESKRTVIPYALAASIAVAAVSVFLLQTDPVDDAAIAQYEATMSKQMFVMDDFMLACDCLVPNETPVPGTVDPLGYDAPPTIILNSL